MVKQTIKYKDYFDVEREEDYYFNLTSNELMMMEYEDPSGSLSKRLEGVVNTNNVMEIIAFIEWIVRKSYGIRTNDGRTFRKTEEATEDFIQSAAYEELYISFIDDPDKAVEFVNSLIPKKMPKAIAEELAKSDIS